MHASKKLYEKKIKHAKTKHNKIKQKLKNSIIFYLKNIYSDGENLNLLLSIKKILYDC